MSKTNKRVEKWDNAKWEKNRFYCFQKKSQVRYPGQATGAFAVYPMLLWVIIWV